ncbi:MAG: hypothetical protein IJ325_04605 [Clostridia bacterium]|nr:hypothetical protein [Clostridia bacterium]
MKEYVRLQAEAMKKINDLTMPGEIVIFGSTYMSHFPLYELINKCIFENAVYNRSIEGLTTKEALEIVNDCVIAIHPSKLFLAVGEEDANNPDAVQEYTKLVAELRSRLPQCHLYLIGLTGGTPFAENFNRKIQHLCDDKNTEYICFVTNRTSENALYKARFKQLSCFFRSGSLTLIDAFNSVSI